MMKSGFSRVFWYVLICAQVLYYLGFALWYSQTALGIEPVLDGSEQLKLAFSIHEGGLAEEPFYRAMLYPAILSLAAGLFSDTASLALFARIFNGLCLLCCSLSAARLAFHIWRDERASLITFILIGFNPVLFHFAADPLDVLFSMTLFVVSLLLLAIAWNKHGGRIAFLPYSMSGLAAGLAVAARPQFLLPALALPLLLIVTGRVSRWSWSETFARGGAVFTGLILLLFLQGIANLWVSGQFKILPTQGAFNVWIANKPNAHGRYFVQTVALEREDVYQNPARREAEILYYRETGQNAGENPEAANAYWRKRTVDRIIADPMGWFGQLGWKAYFLLHPHEQYNNKTYIVHQRNSPFLRWNPIYWSIILGLGLAGLIVGYQKRLSWILWGSIAAYTCVLLLTLVSARFRVPLVPLLAVASGGIFCCWQSASLFRKGAAVLCVLLVGGIGLTEWKNVRDPHTHAEDYLLMAQSSQMIGWDGDAQKWAEKSLSIRPDRFAAREIWILSRFNQLMSGSEFIATTDDPVFLNADAVDIPPHLAFAWGTLIYQQGNAEDAVDVWEHVLDEENFTDPRINAAMLLVKGGKVDAVSNPSESEKADREPLLLAAAALLGDADAAARLEDRVGKRDADYLTALLARLYLRR